MIRVVVDDLAFVLADAVVRPTTTQLDPVSPALRHLERVGGSAFRDQLTPSNALGVGAAIVTGGGDLTSDFVIHAIIRSNDEPVSPDGVRRALTSTLQRAATWEFATVAIPPVGTGPGNLTLDEAATMMGNVITSHLKTHPFPADVIIVVETDEDKTVFESLLPSGS